MALSPLSMGLFSWSYGMSTSMIRELTVTPLEEGRRREEEEGVT